MPTHHVSALAGGAEAQQKLLDLLDELIFRSNESSPGEERSAMGDLPRQINALASQIGLEPGPGLEVNDRGMTIYDPVQRRRCQISVDWRSGFSYDQEVNMLLPLLRWRRLIASRSAAPGEVQRPPEIPRLVEAPPAEVPAPTPMTEAQKAVWDALKERNMTVSQLAEACDTSEDATRQAIRELRDGKHDIRHRKGFGYWRPDAPRPR